MRRASSAYQRNWSTESCHSRRDWASGLPDSSVMVRAAASVRAAMASATLCRISARVQAGVTLQVAKAWAAEAIASRVSSADAIGTSPSGSPVAGSSTGFSPAPPRRRHAPSMNRPRSEYIGVPSRRGFGAASRTKLAAAGGFRNKICIVSENADFRSDPAGAWRHGLEAVTARSRRARRSPHPPSDDPRWRLTAPDFHEEFAYIADAQKMLSRRTNKVRWGGDRHEVRQERRVGGRRSAMAGLGAMAAGPAARRTRNSPSR